MRVLVIDDEPVIRSLVAAVLMDAGFEVGMAADGESGLRAASSLLPHVVLLDIGLPGINGWEVLRALRERSETYRTPVVVLSRPPRPGGDRRRLPGRRHAGQALHARAASRRRQGRLAGARRLRPPGQPTAFPASSGSKARAL